MAATPLRIAFLTPEFVTELSDAGGLASYLARMVQALRDAGHKPEVITLSNARTDTVAFGDVPVHHVKRSHVDTRVWRRFEAFCWRYDLPFLYTANMVAGAWQLARRLKQLDRHDPFDVIQSSDFGITGMFVPRRTSRRHVVRCSWAGELFLENDHAHPRFTLRTMGILERRCIRRADRAYAPSQFVARYYRDRYGLPLGIVRPPMGEPPRAGHAPLLPDRFLLHFGQLSERKGTDLVAAALPLVWAAQPDVQMVWAGKEMTPAIVERSRALWAEHAARVTYLGAIDRGALNATIARAVACVLPSRLDNLPNTVIESLALGVPVIGSAGASIDELIQDGVNGRLVPIGDVPALARAIVDAWNQGSRPACRSVPILDDMAPQRAVEAFLAFAMERE